MRIYYQNSNNEKLYLDEHPYMLLSKNSLFNYEWDYVTKGINIPTIAKFSKLMVKKSVSVVVSGSDSADYSSNLDDFLAKTDIDIINLSPGRLYVGEYYLTCYFTQSSKSDRYINTTRSTIDLTIVAEKGGWVKESFNLFGETEGEVTSGFDYPFDYMFDYGNSLTNRNLVNDSYAPSEFEIIVNGACENPAISINSTTYEVEVVLLTGEYLVINSLNRKIYRVRNTGQIDNLFDARNRDFDIFEKIPTGTNVVVWDGSFTFSVNLLAERSEPKWS